MSLKVQVVSDLHLEYSNAPPEKHVKKGDAEVLIIAGDIGSAYKLDQLRAFFTYVCGMYEKVLYTPGNHEYYREKGYDELDVETLRIRLLSLEKQFSNLVILDQKYVMIDGICFAGCTLWSKVDFRIPPYIVRIQKVNLVYNAMHLSDRAFIERCIQMCQKKGCKLVMITHHPPSYDVLPSHTTDEYVSLYANHMDELLTESKVSTWIFGHTHYNVKYTTEMGTHILSNQLGKPRDKVKDYDPCMIVEV